MNETLARVSGIIPLTPRWRRHARWHDYAFAVPGQITGLVSVGLAIAGLDVTVYPLLICLGLFLPWIVITLIYNHRDLKQARRAAAKILGRPAG